MTAVSLRKTLEHLVDEVSSSSDVHAALEGLVRVLVDRTTTPAQRYTAERALVLAIEQVVAGR